MSVTAVIAPPTAREKGVVYLMAGVQFANVLDFMMVNPLGPLLSEGLHFGVSRLPLVMASYTASAAVSGILGFLFLDRFDRRKALVVCLLGLATATALGGAATSFGTLVATRFLAGAFGGPATSLSIAIVSDVIPAARRGWAMGIVMGGFAVASVLGVPAGLMLARFGGWPTPFLGIGALILIACGFAFRLLPTMRDHIIKRSTEPVLASFARFFSDRTVLLSLGLSGLVMMSGFILIPNIATFVQNNLRFPARDVELLYLFGGLASLVTTRVVGPMVDRYRATRVVSVGTALLALVIWMWFIDGSRHMPMLVLSTAFFIAMSIRGVAFNTLTSKVAPAAERARFQSAQGAVQHAGGALAAFASSILLSELPDHTLLHIERAGWVSIALSCCVPLMVVIVDRSLIARERALAAKGPNSP